MNKSKIIVKSKKSLLSIIYLKCIKIVLFYKMDIKLLKNF